MGSTMDERFAFSTEWYDSQAAMIKNYELIFYPSDNSVEMVDTKNRRMFLRRTKTNEINLNHLYIDAVVNLFSRKLKVVAFGDEFTRKRLSPNREKTCGFIKPDGMDKIGPIIDIILQNGLRLSKLRTTILTKSQVSALFPGAVSDEAFLDLVRDLTDKRVLALELVGDGAIEKFREVCGPIDSGIAKSDAPLSLRARFGTDSMKNVIHCSESQTSCLRETEILFPPTKKQTVTAVFTDSTLCIIKPHAVNAGLTGKILEAISECNFEVTAITMVYMDRANAEEFFEVYKGVVNEYKDMVDELVSGPCVALEIRAQEAAAKFRELCGPIDPEIARHLRPRTLRARFGESRIKNAVHCTDLPEDAQLELEYFFKILSTV